MYILGINGWGERSHDASACLIKNGKIIAMAEEERFVRKKHAYDLFPLNAVAFCLSKAKIGLDDIKYVAVGWDLLKRYKSNGIPFSKSNTLLSEKFFPKKYFDYKKTPNIIFVPHHLAHAASSYYCSGFKKSAILVIDGQGETQSTSLYFADNGNIKLIKEFPVKESLGYFYEAVCKLVGLKTSDGGKLMGLASYGDLKQFDFNFIKLNKEGYSLGLPKMKKYMKSIDSEEECIKAWQTYFKNNFSIETQTDKYIYNNNFIKKMFDFNTINKNIAASAQSAVEKIILHLVALLKEKTNCENLTLSGGVALNCSANGKIIGSNIFKNVYIFPSAADGGVSLGAALYLDFKKNKRKNYGEITTASWGPNNSNHTIKQILDKNKIKYHHSKNISKEVARLISKNKIVGWFQGKMEVGPRALGNRSILADPRNQKNHTIVNNIKGRENWRPLSPSILEGREEKYFEKSKKSPFMLVAFKTKGEMRKYIPAVVHIDGTARPQSVDKTNRKYYNLINEFYKITKIPIVLNTSFNLNYEPIVCSPNDAIKTFYSCPLDYLAIGDYIIKK